MLYVLAGVNGAGKSSVGGHLLARAGLSWFNPDDFARALAERTGCTMPEANGAAWQEGMRRLEDALAAGHEGVMVKSLTDPYAAGRRGRSWMKVKPEHTLDLVVLGAEWGYGRRTGFLSNLHLGARDPDGGELHQPDGSGADGVEASEQTDRRQRPGERDGDGREH